MLFLTLITLKSYFLQVTLVIVTECHCVFVLFCFVLFFFFLSCKFFTNQSTNLPGKTLHFSLVLHLLFFFMAKIQNSGYQNLKLRYQNNIAH